MNRSSKILFWLPRGICVLAIVFVSMFALDAFAPELTIWQQIRAFIMHLIPSFVLIIFLIVAWKKELLGGIIFIVVSLILSPLVFIHNYSMNHSVWMSLGIIAVITIPFAIVGILFIINHFRKNK